MRKSILRSSVFAVSLFCVSSLAGAGAPLTGIPLQWVPGYQFGSIGPVDLDGNMRSAAIRIDALTDRRAKADLIGENVQNPGKPLSVTTNEDVPAFIVAHLKEALRGAGLNIVDSGGDYVLTGELRNFLTTENEDYRTNLFIYGHLKSSDGKELWSGIIRGRGDNFGRSYKAENYYGAYSNAILDTAYNLATNSCFLGSLQKH